MLEKHLENRLRLKIKALGGLCLKWYCASFTGLPDRIVLMPGGRIFFVELKNGNAGRLSARQVVVHRILLNLGFPVIVIKDEETLNKFLNYII